MSESVDIVGLQNVAATSVKLWVSSVTPNEANLTLFGSLFTVVVQPASEMIDV